MSGGLFTHQLLRETEVEIDPERMERLRWRHAEAYRRYARRILRTTKVPSGLWRRSTTVRQSSQA
jgi:hypothetical protein